MGSALNLLPLKSMYSVVMGRIVIGDADADINFAFIADADFKFV